eukprot:4978952-Pyramimonas_sp.AAC.1
MVASASALRRYFACAAHRPPKSAQHLVPKGTRTFTQALHDGPLLLPCPPSTHYTHYGECPCK